MNVLKRRWKLVSVVALAFSAAALLAAAATARNSATPIRVAVLSDCQGAFGSFDNQDLAGVVTAMTQFAGGHPRNRNNPRAGWAGLPAPGAELRQRRRHLRLLERQSQAPGSVQWSLR